MKKNHSDLEPPPPPPPPQPLAARQQQQKTPVITSLSLSELPSTTSTTTTVRIKTEVKAEIIKPNLLTTSPFNTISPPNKTVVDTFEEPNFPENQFDEAIIIAATASEDDLTKFVSPLL